MKRPEKPSGKFVLRIHPDLHARLKKEAEGRRISLNQAILSHIDEQAANETQFPYLRSILNRYKTGLLGVILFGSQARGDALPSSDIDLLLVMSSTIPIQRNLYQEWQNHFDTKEFHLLSPQFVHVPKDLGELSSLWLEVALEGDILYDPRNQLRKTIREIRNRIAAGQYIRKSTHGHSYWVKTGETA